MVMDASNGVQMKKDSLGLKCLPCDRRFKKEVDLENHINAKHQPKKCPLCEETFTTKLDLVSHLNSCMDTNEIEHQLYECDKCHKKINSGERINKAEKTEVKDLVKAQIELLGNKELYYRISSNLEDHKFEPFFL